MTIDWSVSIGQIISGTIAGLMAIGGAYGAVLRIYHMLDTRLQKTEAKLESHSGTLLEHARKMEKHDETLVDILQDVAQIIGSLASRNQWDGRTERRRTFTTAEGQG